MRKRVTKLPRKRHINAVKKSIQSYVNMVLASHNEPVIRAFEGVLELFFDKLTEGKNISRQKGKVVPLRGPIKNEPDE
jgi:hypothetical protein